MADNANGEYTELKEEKEFLTVTTTEKNVVCHFYHQDFRRCKVSSSFCYIFVGDN